MGEQLGGVWPLVRPILFRFDPERAHSMSLRALQLAAATGVGRVGLTAAFRPGRARPVNCMGLTFAHAVGLPPG